MLAKKIQKPPIYVEPIPGTIEKDWLLENNKNNVSSFLQDNNISEGVVRIHPIPKVAGPTFD